MQGVVVPILSGQAEARIDCAMGLGVFPLVVMGCGGPMTQAVVARGKGF